MNKLNQSKLLIWNFPRFKSRHSEINELIKRFRRNPTKIPINDLRVSNSQPQQKPDRLKRQEFALRSILIKQNVLSTMSNNVSEKSAFKRRHLTGGGGNRFWLSPLLGDQFAWLIRFDRFRSKNKNSGDRSSPLLRRNKTCASPSPNLVSDPSTSAMPLSLQFA